MKTTRSMKAATGLTGNEFDKLGNEFGIAWYAHEGARKNTLSGNARMRKFGGGRRSKLKTTNNKLFYILFWFKV